ncbi:hypothetical protein [Mesorhizobium amorphae]|nr:hypothetical protein [Mesorhizobium amorphae]
MRPEISQLTPEPTPGGGTKLTVPRSTIDDVQVKGEPVATQTAKK